MGRWRASIGACAVVWSFAFSASARTPEQVQTSTPAAPKEDPKPAEAPPPKEAKTSTAAPKLELKLPKISGYIQPGTVWAVRGDGEDWTFLLRRARVRFSGEVFVPELTYTIMLDAFAPRVLTDGFISIKYLPFHEIKVGQFKVLFGWENPTSSTVLPTIERTLVSDRLARGPNVRDIGIGIFAGIPIGEELTLEYGATFVNGAGTNKLEDSPGKDLSGRVGVAWGKILRVGASGARVKTFLDSPTPVIEESFRVGGDVELSYGPLFLVAEYIHGFVTDPAKLRRNGFYVLAAGRAPFDLEAVARYERYDPDLGTTDDLEQRLTFGLNYYFFGHNTKVLLDYRHDLGDKREHLLLLQLQYMF